ncbi:hypothetical protein PCA31118_00028 [Pandoraea captiosa]|uniref:Uncharacterized protein n=1 Tax=Pandoraea captiosa TaxID=2508302 RepID=A0A5E4ZFN4_9BURK|nr:hypothetical protein [Pandoraea captiosa]VVE59826.1 hypothetical protein PCA31118_00028 [Pandoraea captiosa]
MRRLILPILAAVTRSITSLCPMRQAAIKSHITHPAASSVGPSGVRAAKRAAAKRRNRRRSR